MEEKLSQEEIALLERVVERIDPQARLCNAHPLAGGVSARVTAFDVQYANAATRRFVLRRHGERDRAANPQIAAVEYRLLGVLAAEKIAAPAPVLLDSSGAIFAEPYLVMTCVDGAPDFTPPDVDAFARQLATYLARLHTITSIATDLAFLPSLGRGYGAAPLQLDETLGETRIRAALDAANPHPGTPTPVLLHGDFWPGNALWRDGRLVAVVDWEDAATGDPLSDVGNARLELLWAMGADAMSAFTRHYRALTALPFANLPYWDLRAALRPAGKLDGWGLDAPTQARMVAQHRWFVDAALAALRDGSGAGAPERGRHDG